jgi:ATP synthase protein I
MGFERLSEPDHQERLKKLNARIAEAKDTLEPKPASEEHYSQAQQGWRMVTELVAGLGIGFGIGYGIDVLLGTIPIFLVLFTFLGFAAGIKTMMRTAQEIQDRQAAERAGDE